MPTALPLLPSCRSEAEPLLRSGRAALLRAMEPVPLVLEPGQPLIEAAEPHEFVYAVESGWLIRTRMVPDGRRQILLIFLPGDFCGVKTMLVERQPDGIEAVTVSSVRRITYKAALAVAAENFGTAMWLAWQLMEDERRLHDWMLRLGRGDAEERVAALLIDLRDRLAAIGTPTGEGFSFPLTQQQIADHVGLTTVHVNRVLRRFREQDMVLVQRGTLLFGTERAALDKLVDPVSDPAR